MDSLNYMHSLAALSHDVYYIEDSDDAPICYGSDMSARLTTPPMDYALQRTRSARLGPATGGILRRSRQ